MDSNKQKDRKCAVLARVLEEGLDCIHVHDIQYRTNVMWSTQYSGISLLWTDTLGTT